uniref:Uncharacterized protein n=1 Tax=viral metagenome TaxID=1070528 RepID=A0A6M3L4B1_9ZZZZ
MERDLNYPRITIVKDGKEENRRVDRYEHDCISGEFGIPVPVPVIGKHEKIVRTMDGEIIIIER